MSQLLTIKDLCVSAEDKQLLHGITLEIESGSTHRHKRKDYF